MICSAKHLPRYSLSVLQNIFSSATVLGDSFKRAADAVLLYKVWSLTFYDPNYFIESLMLSPEGELGKIFG